MLIADFIKGSSTQQEPKQTIQVLQQDVKRTKKQKKGMNLNNIQNLLLPGRQFCDCQTYLLFHRKHKLINNCLTCGRVICEQEGEGPCFFCGNVVLSQKTLDIKEKAGESASIQIASNPTDLVDAALEQEFPEFPGLQTKKELKSLKQTKKENKQIKNFEQLQEEQVKEQKRLEFERNVAVKHRDKLIEQDHEQDLQKNIYDSQMDWYEISHNVWQSRQNRDEAVRNIIAEQNIFDENKKKIQIEFDGWGEGFKEIKPQKNEEQSKENAQSFIAQIEKMRREQQQQVQTIEVPNQVQTGKEIFGSDAKNDKLSKEALSNAKLQLINQYQKEGVAQIEKLKQTKHEIQNGFPGAKHVMTELFDDAIEIEKKVQEESIKYSLQADEEFYDLENTDEGIAISISQPYASLIINGYLPLFITEMQNYNGPIWIYSSGLIDNCEKMFDNYVQFYEKEFGVKINQEDSYSTQVLLGVVDLQIILNQKQFERLLPIQFALFFQNMFNNSSAHAQVLILRNPRKLFYPIKQQAKKKLFKIDTDLRTIAQKCLNYVTIRKVFNQAEWTDKIQKILSSIELQLASAVQKPILKEEPIMKPQQKVEIIEEVIEGQCILRKHDLGYMLYNCLDQSEINEILQVVEAKLINGKKANGPNSAVSLSLDISFPNLEKIIGQLPEMTQDILNELQFAHAFYLTAKQKNFDFNSDYKIIGVFGSYRIEVMVEFLSKFTVKTYQIEPNSFICIDPKQQIKISFQKQIPDNDKKKFIKKECTNLIIGFVANIENKLK